MAEIKLKIASVVIGSGNGGGSGVAPYYADLPDKPSINGKTLSGNKTTEDLGLASSEQVVPSGGTTGQVLTKRSNLPNDVEWAPSSGIIGANANNLDAGSNATASIDENHILQLGIPVGRDAVNPFKGWFTTDNIPTTGQAGDYCNVSDASTTPPTVTIYRWNTTTNQFEDTSEVPDTATGETFASGETLQEVAIDDSHLVNPLNTVNSAQPVLVNAKDIIPIKDNTLFAKISEVKGEGVVVPKYRIDGSGKPNYQSSNFAYTKFNCQGYDYIRVFGLYYKSDWDTVQSSFAFYETEPGTDSTITPITYTVNYKYGTSSTYREYVLPVPKNAVWFAANSKNTQFGSLESRFYCYLIKGDLTTSLQQTVVMYGNDLELKKSDLIPIIDGHTYKVYVKNKNIAISQTGDSSYSKVLGYKYNENRVQVTPYYFSYYGSAEAPESYEFTAEGGYLMLGFRANAGEKQVFQLVDITYAKAGIDGLQQEFDETFTEEVVTSIKSQYSDQINKAVYEGNVGSQIAAVTKSSSSLHGRKYAVTAGSDYIYNNTFDSNIYGFYGLLFTDSSGEIISRDFQATNGSVNSWDDTTGRITAPEGAAFAYINYYGSTSTFDFKTVTTDTIDLKELQSDVEKLKESMPTSDAETKLMKVVVNGGLSPTNYGWTNAYYIRTRYNDEKDIIIQNAVNSNCLLSFNSVYVGANTLTDEQLRTTTYKIVDCDDSVAPFFHTAQYWHLYEKHGYLIPRISNNASLTSASIGTKWQDDHSREYHIGFVDDSYIYLLPVFHQDANGHTVRDWRTDDITNLPSLSSLTFIEAGEGTDEGVASITVAGYTSVQHYPVTKNVGRKFFADGVQIIEKGTYYCDEFNVSETKIGYDPSSVPVEDWFGENGRTILDNAEPLVEFTWSYCYKGANCAMNTTMKLLKEFECYSYGAIQQQFFRTKSFDNKTYTAKILIPKLKSYNTPFNTPSSNVNYYRTSEFMVDVNDPVDRQIGYLVNLNGENDYLLGMAAGLSIVSGDTVKEKRNQNIPALSKPAGTSGSANQHFRLGSISPSLDNKFYIAAINTANYVDNQYYMPAGTFHEINCYVSYFDPAQNKGQVYWYKDGSSYVIYCHAQEASDGAQVINVPEFMEGMNLSVVERTNDTSLLSETITNGKFYVQYTGEGAAKYIVLKAH